MKLYFRCDPDLNKSLCCKRPDITLDLFIDEVRLFDPERTVFMLSFMGFRNGKELQKLGLNYSITNFSFTKKAEVPLEKVLNIQTNLREYDVVTVWFPEGKGCYYLNNGRCGIYEKRPFICRAYPFVNSEYKFRLALSRLTKEEVIKVYKGEEKYLPIFFLNCRDCCKECFSTFEKKGYLSLKSFKKRTQQESMRFSPVMLNHQKFLVSFYKKYFPSYFRSFLRSFELYIYSPGVLVSNATYYPLLSVLLVKEIFGEEGIKKQLRAVSDFLDKEFFSLEDKQVVSVYRNLLAGQYKHAMEEDRDWWNREGKSIFEWKLPEVLNRL